MTLTLELTDEQARTLKAKADARGVSVQQFAQEELLREEKDSESWVDLPHEEWTKRFHEWVQGHDRTTPILSDYAVSRDSIYD